MRSRSVPPPRASRGSQRSSSRRSHSAFACLIHTRVEFTPRRIGRYFPAIISPVRTPRGVGSERANDSRPLIRGTERGWAAAIAAIASGSRSYGSVWSVPTMNRRRGDCAYGPVTRMRRGSTRRTRRRSAAASSSPSPTSGSALS
ncbi:MAG: hypothetical protein A3H36_02000 [Chloroflexi bacterium RIFCSPLOWO2_02_FULL_71_16]|nr:MAG: hypothetical protein A3H36_02000 [Chloroflexi bacterium RIFCSPLOWO2_02_FULL_71_16]